MKLNQKEISLVDFINRIQTLFGFSYKVIIKIGKKASDENVANSTMTYREWIKFSGLKGRGICDKCCLPKHLGKCRS